MPLRRAARPLVLLSVEPHPPLSRGWHRALASGPVAGSASYHAPLWMRCADYNPRHVRRTQGSAGAVGEGEEWLDADGCDATDRHDKANS
jgi:hypothetical protein